MSIGVYCCPGGLVYLLSLVLIARSRRRLLSNALVALLLTAFGFAAFEGLSWWAGLTIYGRSGAYNYPHDYFARGLLGWAIMAVQMLGIFSPLLVVWWATRPRKRASLPGNS
jgi:hypothetical protein